MAPFATILTILILYLLQCIGADYLGEVVLAVRLEAEKDHEVAYRSTHLSLPALPTLFRVGSGAHAPIHGPTSTTTLLRKRRLRQFTSQANASWRKPPPRMEASRLKPVVLCSPALLYMLLSIMMVPGQGANSSRDFNYRIPPAWSPEHENVYSFRSFMTDVSIWIMLTDLQPTSSVQLSSVALEGQLEKWHV